MQVVAHSGRGAGLNVVFLPLCFPVIVGIYLCLSQDSCETFVFVTDSCESRCTFYQKLHLDLECGHKLLL